VGDDDVALASHDADEGRVPFGAKLDQRLELTASSHHVETRNVGPELAAPLDALGRVRGLGAEDGLAPEHAAAGSSALLACALVFAAYRVLEFGDPRDVGKRLEAVGALDADRDFFRQVPVGPEEAACRFTALVRLERCSTR
jgi:hypothetical protein